MRDRTRDRTAAARCVIAALPPDVRKVYDLPNRVGKLKGLRPETGP
jgi:hypothetical protein